MARVSRGEALYVAGHGSPTSSSGRARAELDPADVEVGTRSINRIRRGGACLEQPYPRGSGPWLRDPAPARPGLLGITVLAPIKPNSSRTRYRRLAMEHWTALGLRESTRDASRLDARTFGLVRIATLIALDAPPASYAWQVANALDEGATPEEILGVLLAVAPQVGGPRVVAAAPEIMLALGLSIDEEG